MGARASHSVPAARAVLYRTHADSPIAAYSAKYLHECVGFVLGEFLSKPVDDDVVLQRGMVGQGGQERC